MTDDVMSAEERRAFLEAKYAHGMPDHRESIQCEQCRAEGVTTP